MAGISTLGVGSGLQLQDILEKLRAVDQKVVDNKKTDITKIESQRDEFTVVKNKLLTLKSAALDLSLAGSFIGRTVTSSSEDVITATVVGGATNKNAAITVTSLATKSLWMTATGMAREDTDVTGGAARTLQYEVADKSTSLAIAAGTTLSQMVEAINSDPNNPGVTASTINDGLDPNAPFKLVMTANVPGNDNRISMLSQLPTMLLSETTAGSLNAQFTVDGIAYQRQSNTVSDVMYGVTLNLKETGNSAITVANNDDGLKKMITTLVTSYNDVVQEVRGKLAYDTETTSFGILAGTTLRDLPFELMGLMSTFNNADPEARITNLYDLGLEFNRDGTITINDTTLSAAISDHGEGVQAFFLGDAEREITGLADTINTRLRTMTGGAGFIEGEITAAQTRIDEMNQKITDDTERLDKKYALLTEQFVALDRYMNEMTSMSTFLTGQFKSLGEGWANSSSS